MLFVKMELLRVKMHDLGKDTLSNCIILLRSLFIYNETRTATLLEIESHVSLVPSLVTEEFVFRISWLT
jgi:hypothetical protein